MCGTMAGDIGELLVSWHIAGKGKLVFRQHADPSK